MTDEVNEIVLSKQDLREVTAFAALCAEGVLAVFEADQPGDSRPRDAIDAAWAFARGGERGKALRDTAAGALKAARATSSAAAREAAWAAMSAAGSAYLHPLAKATQVKHILGAAAYAAHATELASAEGEMGDRRVEELAGRATPAVIDVLRRYPTAPDGGGRVGELIRVVDAALRARTDSPGAGATSALGPE
ncbi:putative immunity protein [Streptomyces sp. NPDC002225]|uniref:putative immunity protein n=1 Tax=Streptomyces sp. NPDC002225 TaxID=3154413 RepID=UPI003332CA23